jgi:hypothetical protein
LTRVITDDLSRGVALTHKGRWLRRDAAGANVNVLNPGEKSDMGESTAVHSVEVSVSALAGTHHHSEGRPRNGH